MRADAYPELRDDRLAPPRAPIAAGLDPASGEQFHIGVVSAAVAAEFSLAQLFNPGDSRSTLIVEAAEVSTTSAVQLALYRFNSPLATLVDRWRGDGAGAYPGRGEARTASAAALPTIQLARSNVLASTAWRTGPLRIILRPGEGLVAGNMTVNVAITAAFHGRELPL